MATKIIVIGLLAYGGYMLYTQYQGTDGKPPVMVVNEQDLTPVSQLPHTKEHNPLYDSEGNERVRIHHTFTTQVQPKTFFVGGQYNSGSSIVKGDEFKNTGYNLGSGYVDGDQIGQNQHWQSRTAGDWNSRRGNLKVVATF